MRINGIKPDVFAALNDPVNHYPLNNRAVTGQYAPGSTFKLVTAAAALQTGMIQPKTSITDPGFFRVPNCKGEKCEFQNAGRKAWGRVDLRRAVTVSSDTYFYGLGARFHIESQFEQGLQRTARAFGLGTKSGIPLPTDKAGRIPDPEWKKRLCEQIQCVDAAWRTGDSINMSIGQGDVLVTPLQLANAYATFGNGGTLFEPKLLKDAPAKEVGRVQLDPVQRQPILDGLKGVISSEEGTAYYAFAGFPNRDFPVAGKTGTAQVNKKHDTAIFAAFAPADAPQYAISVVLEEAGFGGSVAAPVARRILQGIVQPAQPVEAVTLQAGSD